MFSLKFVAAAALLLINAQADYVIDPTTISIDTRNKWCDAQRSSCPLLCTQFPGGSSTTASNTCDSTTLDYTCICGNGLSPNASQYSQTIPYFECVEWGQECVAGCGANNICESNCIEDHPCGAQDPIRINVTYSSTLSTAAATGGNGAAATGSAGVVYTGFGGSAATPTTSPSNAKSGAKAALDMGRSYGLVVVFAGLFAGFALML